MKELIKSIITVYLCVLILDLLFYEKVMNNDLFTNNLFIIILFQTVIGVSVNLLLINLSKKK